jgi:hypothetical protein
MFSETGAAEPPEQDHINPDAEPERQDAPDEDAGPAVDPIEGDQGPQVAEQTPQGTVGGSFDPDAPVRTSAPPPDAQSGVPALPENEGVEAQPEYAGPVGDSGQSPEGSHPEARESPAAAPDADGEGEPS